MNIVATLHFGKWPRGILVAVFWSIRQLNKMIAVEVKPL